MSRLSRQRGTDDDRYLCASGSARDVAEQSLCRPASFENALCMIVSVPRRSPLGPGCSNPVGADADSVRFTRASDMLLETPRRCAPESVSQAAPPSLPAPFEFHRHVVASARGGASHVVRVRCVTTVPGQPSAQQDYTPEMLHWDALCCCCGWRAAMADACGVLLRPPLLGDACPATRVTTGPPATPASPPSPPADRLPRVARRFFHFADQVFRVACVVAGAGPWYTPEMLHWDCLRGDSECATGPAMWQLAGLDPAMIEFTQ